MKRRGFKRNEYVGPEGKAAGFGRSREEKKSLAANRKRVRAGGAIHGEGLPKFLAIDPSNPRKLAGRKKGVSRRT